MGLFCTSVIFGLALCGPASLSPARRETTAGGGPGRRTRTNFLTKQTKWFNDDV